MDLQHASLAHSLLTLPMTGCCVGLCLCVLALQQASALKVRSTLLCSGYIYPNCSNKWLPHAHVQAIDNILPEHSRLGKCKLSPAHLP